MEVIKNLLSQWHPLTEKCGYITLEDEVVELANVHTDPKHGFQLEEIPEKAVALWHTHPSGCSNLSVEDYHLFKSYPKLLHVIVGYDAVSYYFVDADGALLRREPDDKF
jgi:proteasome lid subunit RPN8/RPN11